jgi:hypothetical protein
MAAALRVNIPITGTYGVVVAIDWSIDPFQDGLQRDQQFLLCEARANAHLAQK